MSGELGRKYPIFQVKNVNETGEGEMTAPASMEMLDPDIVPARVI